MIGNSAAMQAVRTEVMYAARSDAKVLITGESGVGKEVVARTIHHESRRRDATLVTMNCAGIPDTLLESELFGHVRGSFTDALRDRRGWLELAHRGTILLDEVGEMSQRMQALLLRFLETGEIHPVGSDRPRAALDVRVIAATNRQLLEEVGRKAFRDDLYYRLNVIHIEVPPLRDRPDDVVPLLCYFLGRLADEHHLAAPELNSEHLDILRRYRWPGNVRELKNVAERLVLRSAGQRVSIDELCRDLRIESGDHERVDAAVDTRDTTAELFDQLTERHESFWSAVYEPFVARDLTRKTLRELVQLGLNQTRGNYKALVVLFNMPPEDYKRFLGFLRKHQCHLPFQRFRTVSADLNRGDAGERQRRADSSRASA